jgi:hypothetical protein
VFAYFPPCENCPVKYSLFGRCYTSISGTRVAR